MAKSGPRQTLFSIGAFAILFDDQGRVLLCHRRDRDMWNLPGGGVESGELPTEAVVRETKEEVGLDHLPPNMSQRQVARIRDAARRHAQPIIRRQLEPALVDVVHRPHSAGGGDGA